MSDTEPDTTKSKPTSTDTPKKKEAHKEPSRWEVYYPSSIKENRHAIHVASFPPIVYFWPSIVAFFFCGTTQAMGIIPEGILGWIAITIFAFNILVIVQDFDQKKFLIMVLLVISAGLLVWIIDMKGFEFLRRFARALIELHPTMGTSAYLILAVILTIFFCWGMIRPMFDYWILEHNEFVHYIQPFGRDMSVPRSGSTVSKDIPHILEYILTLGGGSLVIKREGEIVATIPHIPFLGRRMKVIEKMLSEQRVTTYEHE
jgi:hypothetical protein